MADGNPGIPPDAPAATRRSGRIGPPPVHGLKTLRRAVTQLTTRRLDGRSAVAVRRWKEDVRRDRGGDLTRAEETILELAAQGWVIVQSLHGWMATQPSLVTKKRKVLDVVLQAAQLEEGLARMLDRLGLEPRSAQRLPATTRSTPRSPRGTEEPG